MVAGKTETREKPGQQSRWPTWLRFGWADLLGPLAVLSVVAVVCLWVLNQGVLSVTTVDRAIGSIGLLTGLLASDLMLLQVVLMARIPWVEQSWGHDVLIRRHRWIGFASFWLMMAHVMLFVVDRLSREGGSGWAKLWALFVTDSWMLFATAGTVIIIGVVVTSIRYARRRLRYESWHLLHLYAYFGIIFAFPHQLADGADFHNGYEQAYWWTIYIVALASVLVFRVGLPVWRSVYHRMHVAEVVVEAPGVVSVHVTGHRLDRLRAKSGQFFIWRFRDGPGWTRGNPYTISAAPQHDRLRVTIQAAGDSSTRALTLKAGTRVFIEGPYGTLTAARRRKPKMLLMAAGVGITPMRALLEDTDFAPGEAALIYRYTAEEHAIFRAELEELAVRRGVDLYLVPGPRRADDSWLPQGFSDTSDDIEQLRHTIADITERDVYICGPIPWIVSVRKALRGAGVHPDRMHSEDFAW